MSAPREKVQAGTAVRFAATIALRREQDYLQRDVEGVVACGVTDEDAEGLAPREVRQAEQALLDAFALERVARMDPHHVAAELQRRGVQAIHFFHKGGK